MKRLLFSSLFIFTLCFSSYSQDSKKLIADETTLTDMKSSFKIETTNDEVFNTILKNFPDKITRYMVTYKTDRKGKYKEYTVYFKPDDKPSVVAYFK